MLLTEIVDRAAATDASHPAFKFENAAITYGELLSQANGLAATLVEDGVQPGDRIGLLLPKSLMLPVAVYGVLKAGGVYVPLDAQAPAARLAALLTDAGIDRIIVAQGQAKLVSRLIDAAPDAVRTVIGLARSTLADHDVVCIDFATIGAAATAPDVAIEPEDPAYLLYTSGSTGHPKGILHSHRSAMAYARLAAAAYDVRASDVLGNFAPLHFDQSTFEFLAGPLNGATTVMIPPAFGIALTSLAELIEAERLTIWYSVPAILVQLVSAGVLDGRDLTSLRWVLFGGEPFAPKHLNALMALMPDAHFSNVYGPTEVNQCTLFNVGASDPVDAPLPLGDAWPQTELLIVDGNDAEVSPGETGELLVRSPTMMLGYWQRPELNARAFFHRPASNGQHDRADETDPQDDGRSDVETFYRTGDLVRRNHQGLLEIVGRVDRQIKTRGYRVELDEVEHVLLAHDDVVTGAVVPVEDEAGTFIEAAYVAREGSDLTERDLARHCAQTLSSYAVPRRFVPLAELPVTRTGKIDRRAISDLATRRWASRRP
jgi:amino acid adenylation domain-containing protein